MSRTKVDAGIAVLLFVAAAVAISIDADGIQTGAIALAAFYTLPLAARRRAPLVTVVAIVAGVYLTVLFDVRGSAVILVSLMLASYTAARELDPPQTHVALGLAVGGPILLSALLRDTTLGDQVVMPVAIGGAWLLGRTSRVRAQHLADLALRVELAERQRDEAEYRAAEAERTRIARELHDVVSHSISVITVQAEGVRRRLLADQQVEAERLRDIETSARHAMVEMRRMLGVLRNDGDRAPLEPQPGLDQLPRLVERTTAAGVPVELRVEGDRRPLAAGLDLTAYRIVQEALTNTLRHAGRATACVTIGFGEDRLRVIVEDTGRGPNGHGAGRGLLGMRERVSLYEGTLEAGARVDGGFKVEAGLPLHSLASA